MKEGISRSSPRGNVKELTSALRLPSTESGVPVRACGVELRGAGPSLVTSA